MRAKSWDSIGASPREYEALPVDRTPGGIPGRPACWRQVFPVYGNSAAGVWNLWQCTRPMGHTGRHAAGDGSRIRAVWS